MKYTDAKVTLLEVPDEVSLCINISNCPCQCEGCHSSYLARDIGTILDEVSLNKLIGRNVGISCVSFMGGDADPSMINYLAACIRNRYPSMKIAWYSGRQAINENINFKNFDYIKIGPYIKELGGLDSKETNQKMYHVVECTYEDGTHGYELEDITYKFHKNAI